MARCIGDDETLTRRFRFYANAAPDTKQIFCSKDNRVQGPTRANDMAAPKLSVLLDPSNMGLR
jgi:hypothetical protein